MTLYTARVQQAATAFTDAKMLVLCRDEADLAVAQTDFIFDFLTPACYPGGALPANGAAVTGSLVNLARDVQPAITMQGEAGGRTAITTLVPSATASAATFNGKGLAFANASSTGHVVKRAGAADYLVANPVSEGFVDFCETVWLTATSLKTNTSPYSRTGSAGYVQNVAGTYYSRESAAVTAALPTATPIMLAKIVRFNVGAATTSVRIGAGATGAFALGAAVAGTQPASYPTATNLQTFVGSFDGGSGSTLTGTVHRVTRQFATGWTDAELIARFTAEYAWGQARFA